MKISGNIETILNYFVENIKEVQKNGYKGTELIALLIDLAFNSLETLRQLGEGDEKLQRYIKALIFQSLAHCELDEVCKRKERAMSENKESQELIKGEIVEAVSPTPAIIMDISALQKVAKVYAASSFLPASWRKLPDGERLANLIIIVNRAGALKCDPLLLLQNLDIIAGRMCWRSSFLLQLLQAHGWTGSRYDLAGDPNTPEFWGDDSHGCTFSAINPATGERETGTKITVAMIKGEGWLNKEGSKWRTMPEQMIKYRAVAFFARTNAPAVMGGFYSQDEIEDIVAQERAPAPMVSPAQVVEAEPPKELPSDIKEYLHKRYDDGVARINSDASLVTLAAKGRATDQLVECLERLEGEAMRDVEGFRAKYIANDEEKRKAWVNSPSNPGGSCYHD